MVIELSSCVAICPYFYIQMDGLTCPVCQITFNRCDCGSIQPAHIAYCPDCGRALLQPPTDQSSSATDSCNPVGRIGKLETASDIPAQDNLAEQMLGRVTMQWPTLLTPDDEPRRWTDVLKDSYWFPACVLGLNVFFASQSIEYDFTFPMWLTRPAIITSAICVGWLILSGIIYLISPPIQ
jgi:hypothetical protein